MTGATRVMSYLLIMLGITMLVQTARAGGSALAIGYIIGVLLILAGGARLWLQHKTGGGS